MRVATAHKFFQNTRRNGIYTVSWFSLQNNSCCFVDVVIASSILYDLCSEHFQTCNRHNVNHSTHLPGAEAHILHHEESADIRISADYYSLPSVPVARDNLNDTSRAVSNSGV